MVKPWRDRVVRGRVGRESERVRVEVTALVSPSIGSQPVVKESSRSSFLHSIHITVHSGFLDSRVNSQFLI